MTYCDRCYVEIKNGERRNHLISGNHLSFNGEKYCDLCRTVYSITISGRYSNEKERIHLESNNHQMNQLKIAFLS